MSATTIDRDTAESAVRWLRYARADVVTHLISGGWDAQQARDAVAAVPDVVFQLIRAGAVAELAETYGDPEVEYDAHALIRASRALTPTPEAVAAAATERTAR